MSGRVAFDLGPIRRSSAGVGRYAAGLFSALVDGGYAFHLSAFGLRGDAEPPRAELDSRRRRNLPYPVWVETVGGINAKRTGASVAHYTDSLIPVVRSGRAVVTIHDLTLVTQRQAHRTGRYPRIPLLHYAARSADRILVPSRSTADDLVRHTAVDPARIRITPLAASPAFSPVSRAESEPALLRHGLVSGGYILSLGTIEPRKNHGALIEAFELVVRRKAIPDDMQLVVAGSLGWGYGPILRRIEGSRFRARIKLLGFVPEADLAALLSSATAVAYPSLAEGFGLPVLEALACGAPVLTSNCSSMPEVAGDAALLVDPQDVTAIADGIEELANLDPASRRRVSEAAVVRAAQFSWTSTAAATAAVYLELL